MSPSHTQTRQKRLLTLVPPNLTYDNTYSPALDDSHASYLDTRIRKPLNVPRGNPAGPQGIPGPALVLSNLVCPGEFPEPDARELQEILKNFEKSLTWDPEPSIFDTLVYVALLSRKHQAKRWESWATNVIKNFVRSSDPPLLDRSPSKTFVRLLRFVTICQERQLQYEIQGKWIARLGSDTLAPIPAILLADELGNRALLGRALYSFLVKVEHLISNSQRIDVGSPLSHQLNIHVFSGYYALQAYWKDLCDNSLEFREGEGCTAHSDCLTTWRPRWSIAVTGQPSGISHIDVLSRLRLAEETLRTDPLCRTYMTEKCRQSALGAVLQKRDSLALNMHHVFDL